MKHYVLGLLFDKSKNKILLIKKKRPEWMDGFWNGIGGKIDPNEVPIEAMDREGVEETTFSHTWEHVITFVCPGGTVFVFKAFSNTDILFKQVEDEELRVWPLIMLPEEMMGNLKWIIPLSLSTIQFPAILQQNELGVIR